MRPQSTVAFTFFFLCACLTELGCSEDQATPPDEPVLETQLGGFALRSDPASADLDVRASDGRMLLDGLGAGAVEQDEPPLVGFAVRDITRTYEMQFGAFKPTETEHGAWRAAMRSSASLGDEQVGLNLMDGSGAILARLGITSPTPGHLRVAIEPGDGPERRFSWGFACDDQDHFMGFGAQAWDVDHRGQSVYTWVEEQGIGKDTHDDYEGAWMLVGRRHSSHIPIPQYLSRRGYIMTVETQQRATFALCSEREDTTRVEMEIPTVVHLFDGPEPPAAIERATERFGRPRMPPRVAFAPWSDAIYGSENVRRVAAKLRERGVPSSVIWSEDWKGAEVAGDAYRLSEEWEVDRVLYPDFEQLAQDLHASGFQFYVYFNTFIYEGTTAWNETAPKGWLVQRPDGTPYTFIGGKMTESGLLDLTHPDARAWAKDKLTDAMNLGADGWMGDFAEWMPTDGVTYAGPSIDQHNDYPVQWQEVQREAIDDMGDGVERLFFGRSGYFGTPQLADVIWAGDQRTSFKEDDGLPTIVPIGVGLGVVGVSTYGHDIAGYQSSSNPGSTKELFFRWTELGAWSPVMRTHHGYFAKKNWSWESDDETIEHFARYARLHISLAPYWEGLAAVASSSGLPIWRGLGLLFPQDAQVWPIKDQVMVGDGVMIAPVVTEGATSRTVYLPAGRWYRWDVAGAPVQGPTTVHEPAPLDAIPVFARAGAIVPMYPDGVMTLVNESPEVPGPASVGDNRVVHVFVGDDGSFTEAAGLGYSVEMLGQSDSSGAVTYTWKGSPLAACGATALPPCVENAGSRREKVHVVGPGALEVSAGAQAVARISATGGAADRTVSFDVRR